MAGKRTAETTRGMAAKSVRSRPGRWEDAWQSQRTHYVVGLCIVVIFFFKPCGETKFSVGIGLVLSGGRGFKGESRGEAILYFSRHLASRIEVS